MQHLILFKRMFVVFFCFFCHFGHTQNIKKDSHTISGTLDLDQSWNPVVYLSYISSFDELHALSSEMIITGADIDSTGAFIFNIDFLPKEDRLYRLHITKKEAPISSLIIGGKDQNHLFIIANSSSNITVKGSSKAIFNKALIKGNNDNNSLFKIDQIASFLDSIPFEATALQRNLETRAVYDQLRMIADTSSHSLVSLYALYKTRFKVDFDKDTNYYDRYREKWKDCNNSYFKAFRRDFPVKQERNVYVYFITGFISLCAGYMIKHSIKRRKGRIKKQLKLLSVQERKVFALLQKGKSNKEISQELNIGVNTVKSHVSNVYSKLEINSRKDIIE
jgi:DNA-binding CsgD family transcriptional regulator